jgi:hypothetical protein
VQWLARRADFNDSHPATPLLPGRCQDIEFTVENGKLYMLQTRTGKRTARAAVRIAVDMVKERMLTEREALMRIDAAQVRRAPLQISSSSSLTCSPPLAAQMVYFLHPSIDHEALKALDAAAAAAGASRPSPPLVPPAPVVVAHELGVSATSGPMGRAGSGGGSAGAMAVAAHRLDAAAAAMHRLESRAAPLQSQVLGRGLGASTGAACGALCFTVEAAQAARAKGESVILCRQDTSPEDIVGLQVRFDVDRPLTLPSFAPSPHLTAVACACGGAVRGGHPDHARRDDEPRGRDRARHGQERRHGRLRQRLAPLLPRRGRRPGCGGGGSPPALPRLAGGGGARAPVLLLRRRQQRRAGAEERRHGDDRRRLRRGVQRHPAHGTYMLSCALFTPASLSLCRCLPVCQVMAGADEAYLKVVGWADKYKRMGVLANAETPADVAKAVEMGAEGVGLCRTEHMFFSPRRLDLMRAMILADDEDQRRKARPHPVFPSASAPLTTCRAPVVSCPVLSCPVPVVSPPAQVLAEMLPLQRADFLEIFKQCAGKQVRRALIQPP